jgi:hypothetical protein
MPKCFVKKKKKSLFVVMYVQSYCICVNICRLILFGTFLRRFKLSAIQFHPEFTVEVLKNWSGPSEGGGW